MPKRDYLKEIDSPLSKKILEQLQTESYTKKISENLNSAPQTISNFMNGLRRAELIKREHKIKRKQFYKITDRGEKFLSLLKEKNKIENRIDKFKER